MGALLLVSGCKSREGDPPTASDARASGAALLPRVVASLASLRAAVDGIPAERKEQLDRLALFVRTKRSAGEPARLLFICTHNSRRSHFGQIWASAAAAYYGIDGIEAYSGGTETSAFNPRAIAALERAGFEMANPGGTNPHVKVTYATGRPPLEAFSKKYDDAFNPKEGFAAVMTCSAADKSCPFVTGSKLRVALPYDDPKSSDGTEAETATYDDRSRQIGTEMMYLFSRVKA
jgi:arsenate reductase